MNGYSLRTPEQVSAALAARVRELRLARGWRQVTLAERSGVSLASLRRFETSGRVSLQNLLKLVFALNRLDDFRTCSEGLERRPSPSSRRARRSPPASGAGYEEAGGSPRP